MVTVIRMVIRKTLRILWFVLSAATPLHDRAGCMYNDSVTTQADGIYQKQKAEFMTKHVTKHMTNRMTDNTKLTTWSGPCGSVNGYAPIHAPLCIYMWVYMYIYIHGKPRLACRTNGNMPALPTWPPCRPTNFPRPADPTGSPADLQPLCACACTSASESISASVNTSVSILYPSAHLHVHPRPRAHPNPLSH